MVTAIVLINTRRDKIPETVQALVDLPGVAEVYSVAGEYDVAAIIRVKENEQLADLVTRRMLKLDGIERTHTLIAFESFSKFDLDRMFAIGMD
jgi:DNA-binding Lrp family transcriptional regulator